MITPAEMKLEKLFFMKHLKKNVVKFYIVFIVEMVMLDNDNKISTSVSIPFRSKTYTVSVIDKESIKKK
jgi:hypothetical protein